MCVRDIQQFNSVNTVNIEGDKIVSNTVVIEKHWEGQGTLFMDIKTFKIEKALYELHIKGENPCNICEEIPELKGLSGYMDGKKDMNVLTEKPNGDKLKYMFLQCINGMIQAETYVYKERGFQAPDEYNKYWDKLEENGCRMYSNVDPSDLPWMEYAGPLSRKINLFNRFKRATLIKKENGDINISASFTDSYHELIVELALIGQDMVVENCDIQFVRAPGVACFHNSVHGQHFVGRKMKHLNKRDLIESFGKSQGCYHIVDVMLDVYRKLQEMKGEGDE